MRSCRSDRSRLALAATLTVALGLAVGLPGCEGDSLNTLGSDAGTGATCPNGAPRPQVARCAADTDCCPRESCFVGTGVCFARDACDTAADCPMPGQVCRDANADGFRECVFERCDDTDPNACVGKVTCPPDKLVACINGGCACGEPCQGGCPSSQGCCIPTNTCADLPAECMGLSCPVGQFVSVTSTGAWDTGSCRIAGEQCSCQRLPPLPLGDIGLHSALAHDGRTAVMSAYNLDYGDLMFGVVSSDGSVAWEFVDGVPTATSSITGDVDGPRGGNSLPGPDVGLYTDVAVDPRGRPHIAYQDRDHGALDYAVLTGTGWRVHAVDGLGVGDTGLYSSLGIDAGGRARIAYLSAREEGPNGRRRSVLRLAHTATTTPSAASSWELRDLVTTDLSRADCVDRCNPGEVCRASDQACVQPDAEPTACGTSCGPMERCLGRRCTAISPLPAYHDLPAARGLWPSLAMMPDGGIAVAYYDRVERNLKVARIRGPDLRNGPVSVVAIDGTGVNGSADDAGLYPSLYATPGGELHLSYMNATRHSLWYRALADDLSTTVLEEVDAGSGTSSGPEPELIGADGALVVDRTGTVRIAYQDATRGDLRYARRSPGGGWALVTLAGDEATYRGSFGFYTDQTLDQNRERPLVSTYRYFLSAPNGPENGVETFVAP